MTEPTEPAQPPVGATGATDTSIHAHAPAAVPAPATAPATSASPRKARRPWLTSQGLDRCVVVLLFVLTFFLGAFAVRNAEFLMNLASGRLIAHGEYVFGTDPFAYGTENVVWVNHSWLYDLLVYMLWSVVGDAGPIVFKALLLVLLVLVLLATCRRDQSAWLPVLCIGLAVLVMSQRFLMQSTVISLLFLGITVYVLRQSNRIWLLPALFALWVNLDVWFVLGPLTVALYLVGSVGQRLAGQSPRHGPARLAGVLLAGVAACLINPYHYRAFALPPELAYLALQMGDMLPSWMVESGRTVEGLISGEGSLPLAQQVYRLLWLSPLSEAWRTQAGLGNNVAGVAYFPLLLLGLMSFVVPAIRKARTFPWPRFLIWLFFAFLSLTQARMIAFFAVVSGPVMALSFQEYWTELWTGGTVATIRRPSILGRLVTAVALLVLIGLAWPGWLNGRIYPFDFHSARRVAWGIDFDPSLRAAAERLGELHKQGVIHHGFPFSPDVACYCALFTPEVKGFIDYRYALFADRAQAFSRSKLALASHAVENRADPQAPALVEWRKLADKYGIDYIVLTNFSRGSNATRITAGSGWIEPARWPWLYGDGRTLIFGWNPSGADSPLTRNAIELGRLAFGAVPASQQAPGTGALPEGRRDFWESYLNGINSPSLALDAAEQFQVYRKLFSDQRQQLQRNYLWLALWAIFHGPMALNPAAPATVTVPAALGPPVFPARREAPSMLHLLTERTLFGPPSAAILMTRNVRRALADDPYDASAYEVLANSIELEGLHEELLTGRREPGFRQQLRQLQMIAAWKTYLTLKPNDPRAHQAMFVIYLQQLQYLDVALEHLGLAVKNWTRQAANNPQALQQLEAQRKSLEDQYQRLEAEVKKRQADFDLRTTGVPPLQKVYLAIGGRPGQGLGLARRALQALQQVRLGQVNQAESITVGLQQVSLLLLLGEIRQVNENLDSLKGLGSAYFRTEVYCAAIAGEYDRTDAAIATLLKGMALQQTLPVLALFPMKLAPSLTFAGSLAQVSSDIGPYGEVFRLSNLRKIVELLHQSAEWNLVRGLLALERGNTSLAEQSFQKVLDLTGTAIYFPERAIAERYVKLIRDR